MGEGAYRKVVIVGAGNVASAIAPAIDRLADYHVVQVISRTKAHALALAACLADAAASDDFSDTFKDADIGIIAVNDDSIAPVVSALMATAGQGMGVWLHVSASRPLSILSPLGRHGVMYPLQTFTKGREVDFAKVSFFVEGDPEAAALARALSPSVTEADSQARARLHIAAVFACNFTNRLLAIAQQQLAQSGVGLDVLRALVDETVEKAFTQGPVLAQTGPARRRDASVTGLHLSMLDSAAATLYRDISDSIQSQYEQD